MPDAVRYEQEGHIVTLTMDRPEMRNALVEEVVEGLVACCDRINADQGVRVVILTGAGSAFSAGGNLKDIDKSASEFGGTPAELRNKYLGGIQRMPLAFYGLEVPAIAAVNGPAIGAGCDLTTMCDIRIASTKALFSEAFVKLGLIPGDGGAWLLPRAVGLSRASEMAFTGDRYDAQAALEFGLVSRVVEPEELLDAANDLAGRIAVNPPHALRMAKRLIREGQRVEFETLLEMSASMQSLAHHAADHKEAISAMLEKRPPKFADD